MTTLLIAMLAVVVALSTVDLAWVLLKDIITPPIALLDVDELMDVFGAFLLVLIGIELLETLKVHAHERETRVEVIILVAVIALSRKIVTLDVKTVPSASLLGVGAIILALGLTYRLIRHTHDRDTPAQPPRPMERP